MISRRPRLKFKRGHEATTHADLGLEAQVACTMHPCPVPIDSGIVVQCCSVAACGGPICLLDDLLALFPNPAWLICLSAPPRTSGPEAQQGSNPTGRNILKLDFSKASNPKHRGERTSPEPRRHSSCRNNARLNSFQRLSW